MTYNEIQHCTLKHCFCVDMMDHFRKALVEMFDAVVAMPDVKAF